MIKKHTYNFLIFEVLVALFIISMSILPFSSYPYKAFQKEISFLHKMTMEPYFTKTFEEAILLKEEYTPKDLTAPFGTKEKLIIKRKVEITTPEKKENAKGTLYHVKVTLSSKNTTLSRTKIYYEGKNQ